MAKGDKIYVNPTSIVGSIGVVGGKISMAGLYDHLNVNITTRTRGPMADMWSSDAAWTDARHALYDALDGTTVAEHTRG